MNCIELIAQVRSRANQRYATLGTEVGSLKDFDILQWLNDAQNEIFDTVREVDPSHFWAKATLTESSTSQIYEFDIHQDMAAEPYYLVRSDGLTSPLPYRQVRAQDFWRFDENLNLILRNEKVSHPGVWMRWTQGRIRVEPDSLAVTSLDLYYQRRPPELTFGVAKNTPGANTTITLNLTPGSDGNTPVASIHNDYYNNVDIDHWSEGATPTYQRDVKTVSDYVGLTGVLTVSSAWTGTNPDSANSSKYATIPFMPVGWESYLVDYATSQARYAEREFTEGDKWLAKSERKLARIRKEKSKANRSYVRTTSHSYV